LALATRGNSINACQKRKRGLRGIPPFRAVRVRIEAPPLPRSARQPRRKMFLAFQICARPIFSEKGKDIFSFGFCPEYFGQCGGAKCGLGFAKTIFWGKEFRKTSADVCLRGGKKKGSGENEFPLRPRFGWRRKNSKRN